MKKIQIKIDGKKILCNPEQSVLQVAIDNKIDIPHFCYHEDLPIDAHCRACLVEVNKKVVTSCNLKVESGLSVLTDSPKVRKLRNENLELLLADHKKLCKNCKVGYYCKTAALMRKYRISGTKYHRKPINKPVHKLGCAAEFDPQACISCGKCVEMCEKIGIGFLKLEGKGADSHLTYNCDPEVDCIYCGQCTVHCPVAAVHEQNEIKDVEAALRDKDKIVIAQMAPSVRASIGEEFGLEPGSNMEAQMYTALRKLGFDYIFDVNMGADITTYVEATELAERIKKGGVLPMFTSCCPGWVKYAEFYHPEILPNLTTSRSPQIHSGGAYKTWWAKKMKIKPKKIVVVSFMPCTSKKYEAKFEKLKIKGMFPVDHVLTTRETASLLKKRKIDLPNLEPGKVDSYGEYSGAAAIYGASGGVMESALRSAYFFITGKELKEVKFKEVRGMKYVKEAKIRIGRKVINVAVCAMAKNAGNLIEEVKKHPNKYHYIEVMACPGGCIGGGGQPIPSTERIIAERIKALYKIDNKCKVRKAHLNPVVQDFFDNYIAKISKRKASKILHTSYKKKKKFE
ncbi:iron hydrogenase small subunit [Candidatus Peregrinibacteria bacterium]|nr:iron hydrogenase small subunit [Candidatus Peregrinibacteria bacterium]